MKKLKKILSSILVAMMLLSALTATAFAADLQEDTVAVIQYTDSQGNTQTIEYTTLNDALAASYSNDVIYLVKDAQLSSSAELKRNVTLVIPTKTENYADDNTTTGHNVPGNPASGNANITLTIPEGVTLSVTGNVIVAGNQQSTVPKSGYLTGDYGAIDLVGNIEVNANGKLYARGEISGNGTVTVTSGGTVYERFEIDDWRGGSASESAFNAHIFPFNLYKLAGISCDLVLEAGSYVYGQSYIYAASLDIGASIDVPYISDVDRTGEDYDVSGSVITFVNPETTGGTITLSPDDNGNTTITFKDATVETGNLTYTVRMFGFTVYSFSSADTDCPFGYKTDLVIDNSTMNIRTALEILPGCEISVVNNGTMNIETGGAVNLYTADKYSPTFNNPGWTSTENATLTVEEGSHVTTTGEGFLASSSDKFVNIFGLGTLTADGTNIVEEVTQSGTSVTQVDVTFFKAVLPTAE